MKLSLIIPNFNNAKYLKKCIKSVIKQTRVPNEIIIIDAGSDDGSLEIIKKYAQKYPFIKTILKNKKDGVALDRHEAILKANGDYITTLDGDDYYYSRKKIESEMKLIENNDGKIIYPYSNIILVNKNGKKIKKNYNEFNYIEGNCLEPIISRKKPIPRDFIFKKKIYLDIGGYDHNLKLYEDWDLKIRLSPYGEYKYTNIDGVAYRQHDTGLSSRKQIVHIYYKLKVFRKNIYLVKPRLRIKIFFYLLFDVIKTNFFATLNFSNKKKLIYKFYCFLFLYIYVK